MTQNSVQRLKEREADLKLLGQLELSKVTPEFTWLGAAPIFILRLMFKTSKDDVTLTLQATGRTLKTTLPSLFARWWPAMLKQLLLEAESQLPALREAAVAEARGVLADLDREEA